MKHSLMIRIFLATFCLQLLVLPGAADSSDYELVLEILDKLLHEHYASEELMRSMVFVNEPVRFFHMFNNIS